MTSINDILNFDSIWLQFMELNLALTMSANFGLGLTGFDIFQVDFNFELPSIEELLQGINIKVFEVDLESIFREFMNFEFNIEFPVDEILDYFNTLKYFFKLDMFPGISGGYSPCCKYGEGRFGFCAYYDPTLTVRIPPTTATPGQNSLLQTVAQSSLNPQVLTQWTTLLGNENLARALLTKMDYTEQILENAFFLGLNMLGYSQFAPRSYQDGVEGVYMTFSDGTTLFISSVDTIFFGFILGKSLLGLDRFVPPGATAFTSVGPRFAYYRAMRQKARFQSRASALVWRRRWEEMQSVHRSRAILKYATHRFNIQMLRRKVKNMLRHHVTNPFDLNKYVIATVDLVYRKRVGHKKAKEWKSKLTDEEFKEMWLDKWEAQGLNRNLLQQIYGEFITWVDVVRKL